MSASCDLVEAGVREFLEGAKDLEKFAAAMKKRFGKDIDPAILQKAFEKAANRYQKNIDPLDDIKLELAQELAKSRRSGVLETATALRRAGLLSGPKTIVRNTAGNAASMGFDAVARIPAALVDLAIGKWTGSRTISPFNMDATRRAVQGMIRDGWKDAKDVMTSGMTTSDFAKYDVPRELNAYIGDVELKPINRWVNFINRFQGAQDKPFRAYAYNRSLAEQAHLVAGGEKLTGKARADRINELIASPPEAMQLQAIADAEQAVFANSNRMAEGLTALGDKLGDGGRFMLDTLVPFRKVPTNVAGRVLESSPVGMPFSAGISLKRLIAASGQDPQAQKAFSMAIGRGASGSALIGLGYLLAQNGKMSAGFSNDKGISGREEAVGHSPGALLLGGKSYQLDGSPAGILLAVGASMYRDSTEGKRPLSVGMSGVTQVGKELLDTPFLQGASDAVDTVKNPTREGPKMARNLAGSMVPSIVNTIGEATDTTQRAPGTPLEAIQARIPAARTRLPPKRDALGEEIRTANWWNPIEGKTEKNTPVTRELDRLKIRIQKPSRITDPKHPSFDKDERAYQERVRFIGESVRKALDRAVKAEWYKNTTDEVRKKRLDAQIHRAKSAASKRLQSEAKRKAFYERVRKSP